MYLRVSIECKAWNEHEGNTKSFSVSDQFKQNDNDGNQFLNSNTDFPPSPVPHTDPRIRFSNINMQIKINMYSTQPQKHSHACKKCLHPTGTRSWETRSPNSKLTHIYAVLCFDSAQLELYSKYLYRNIYIYINILYTKSWHWKKRKTKTISS